MSEDCHSSNNVPKKQEYFFHLSIRDMVSSESLVHIAYKSNYLDEMASTLRSQEIQLLELAKERDKDRYVIIYKAEWLRRMMQKIGIKL